MGFMLDELWLQCSDARREVLELGPPFQSQIFTRLCSSGRPARHPDPWKVRNIDQSTDWRHSIRHLAWGELHGAGRAFPAPDAA